MKKYLPVLACVLLAVRCFAQVVPSVTAQCATSIDGSVVGTPNPMHPPVINGGFSGSLPPGTYYVEFVWYDASNNLTLPSPEIKTQSLGSGNLQVSPPSSGMPATAVGMEVFIGTSSGTETLQGVTTGSATYTQSGPLVTGAALPVTNTTLCKVIANDSGWPTGTGYNVGITTPAGASLPGFPQQWQLLGPGNTINLGQGFPLYNGTVQYPVPIMAQPYGHATQSIAGGLNLGKYTLTAGSITSCLIDTITYIGGSCAAYWGGGDIGSQANAAYAALPTNGGLIQILPSSTAYAYSTPIVFGTPGKLPVLDLGGNVLNYTPTTNTVAINLNYGSPFVNGGSQPHGVRNGVLQNNGCQAGNGCGGYLSLSSATGIQLSTITPAVGAIGPTIENVAVSGFNLGLQIPTGNNLMWGALLINDQFSSNNAGVQCSSGGVYENLMIFGSKFTVNKNALLNACNADIYLKGSSFDQNDTAINQESGTMNVEGAHFEMNAPSSVLYVLQSGGGLNISGSHFQDDNSSGSLTQVFNCITASTLTFGSGNDFFSAGRTYTDLLNTVSGCNFVADSGFSLDGSTPSLISNIVGGPATNITYLVNDGTQTNTIMHANGYAANGVTVSNLGSAATFAGTWKYVTDSTAIAAEGQTCAGSSTNKALAFSNGTVWKCF